MIKLINSARGNGAGYFFTYTVGPASNLLVIQLTDARIHTDGGFFNSSLRYDGVRMSDLLLVGHDIDNNDWGYYVAYILNPSVGEHVFSWTGQNFGYANIEVAEYSGVDPNGPVGSLVTNVKYDSTNPMDVSSTVSGGQEIVGGFGSYCNFGSNGQQTVLQGSGYDYMWLARQYVDPGVVSDVWEWTWHDGCSSGYGPRIAWMLPLNPAVSAGNFSIAPASSIF
jgi:hypothetical protein